MKNDDTTAARSPLRPPDFLRSALFAIVVVVAGIGALIGLRVGGKDFFLHVFTSLHENLPLTLPILSAALSTLLGIRELLKPFGWLRLPTSISLGLVSFSIWFVVAAQSTTEPYIRIGTAKVLNREFAVILVVVAFIWAAFCAMARVLGESILEVDRHWLWYTCQGVLVFGSVIALFLPFFLFENKQEVEARLNQSLDERYFAVSIPFRDNSLNQHLGRTADPITEVIVIRQIAARTPTQAVAAARATFAANPMSRQQYGHAKEQDQAPSVEVFDAWIVVEQEPGTPQKRSPAQSVMPRLPPARP